MLKVPKKFLSNTSSKVTDKFDFLHKDKHQSFYRLRSSFLLGIARHPQSTLNNDFANFLQYLKKEERDEVDFLQADKHQTFLQVDTINFGGQGQLCSKNPK